jgi:hypothetical protein
MALGPEGRQRAPNALTRPAPTGLLAKGVGGDMLPAWPVGVTPQYLPTAFQPLTY